MLKRMPELDEPERIQNSDIDIATGQAVRTPGIPVIR